jgi:hypothetical protein
MLLCVILGTALPASAGLEPRSDGAPGSAAPEGSVQRSIALSKGELQELRSTVLRRCALSSKLDQNSLPWYFYYEYGVALLDAGDANRSLEALQMGANLKDQPMRDKRMYGMWFIDYLPYFQIARAHSALGDWDSADAALDLSEELERISRGDYDYPQYSELRSRIASQEDNAGRD